MVLTSSLPPTACQKVRTYRMPICKSIMIFIGILFDLFSVSDVLTVSVRPTSLSVVSTSGQQSPLRTICIWKPASWIVWWRWILLAQKLNNWMTHTWRWKKTIRCKTRMQIACWRNCRTIVSPTLNHHGRFHWRISLLKFIARIW